MKKNLLQLTAVVITTATLLVACNNGDKPKEGTAQSSTTETTKATEATPKDTATMEKGVMVGGANMVPSKDIVDNAANSTEHTTLVAAVKAAGLVETLKGAGPFTVFAPTNAAFDALPKGTVEGLLKPEKKADLTSILTYHVVPGAVKAADLKDGQKIKTVQGKELTVSIKEGKVMIDGALVTIADVISKNGVTHVINAVVMPKK